MKKNLSRKSKIYYATRKSNKEYSYMMMSNPNGITHQQRLAEVNRFRKTLGLPPIVEDDMVTA